MEGRSTEEATWEDTAVMATQVPTSSHEDKANFQGEGINRDELGQKNNEKPIIVYSRKKRWSARGKKNIEGESVSKHIFIVFASILLGILLCLL